MSPLIGRTCTCEMGLLGDEIKLHHAIIMDVQSVYLAESAGSVSRTRGDGWNLLLLLEGGTLVSAPHHEVKVE